MDPVPGVPPQRPIRRRTSAAAKKPPPLPIEIEAQLKIFLGEIIGDDPDATVDFTSADFISKFLAKLQGPPWFLKLHPANLIGANLNLQNFVGFIQGKLEKLARERLLVPRGISDNPKFIPLSYPQEQIWLQMQEASTAPTLYNYSGICRFSTALDPEILSKTLDFLMARHETLRTTFHEIDGKACQRIGALREFSSDLKVIKCSTKQFFNLGRILHKNLHRSFDFQARPLIRFYLFVLNDSNSLLQMVGHHIMCDGMGFSIFEQDVRKTYAAFAKWEDPILPVISTTYSDYVLWQRETLKLDGSPSSIFWREYLNGFSTLEIPRDRPKVRSMGNNSARIQFEFSPVLTDLIRKFSKDSGVTPFVTLLGGLSTLFYIYIPQSSISLLTAKHGRTCSKLRGIMGHFINTLIIRTKMNPELSFRNLVQSINASLANVYEHEEYPFQYVLRDLISNARLDKMELFPVFVVMMPRSPGQSSTLSSNYTDIDNHLLTNEMTIILDDGAGTEVISGYVKYNPVTLTRRRILRMIDHLKTLLENGVLLELSIQELNVIPSDERKLLAQFGRGREVYFNKNQTLVELFEYIARARAENLAVMDDVEELNFKMLNLRAEALAFKISEISVSESKFVAILLPQSIQFLTVVLGVLKTGLAVVPLSVHASVRQIEVMLQELGSPLLITDQNIMQKLGLAYPYVLKVHNIKIDAKQKEFQPKPRKQGPAYCIFTSGSTGKPKAVMIDNSSLVNLVNWMQSEFEINSSDRSLFYSNSAYDASLIEYWPFFLTGASVLIPPANSRYDLQELMQWVNRRKVTVMNLPTAMAYNLVTSRDSRRLTSVRLLTCGGEKLQKCRTEGLPFKMVNSYGLTESCVLTTSGPVSDQVQPSVGKPIWNSRVYVLEPQTLKILPIGITGEICIAGAGVSRGYLSNSENFVPNPYGNGTICKTGDLGYWLPDGNLVVIGRSDNQVKIRGHRIELEEIEEVLTSHPLVNQAVAVVHSQSRKIQAYCEIIKLDEAIAPTYTELKSFLQERLPYYAVPTQIYFVDSFPYNANGKVDREILHTVQTSATTTLLQPLFEPVLTSEEKIVASIWADVLNIPVESIGRQSNFFALGGQSILIADVVNRLRDSPLFASVKVSDLFKDPSLVGFSNVVCSNLGKSSLKTESGVNVVVGNCSIDTPIPLSYPQEHVWLHMQESKDPTLYNEACTLTFDKDEFNVSALKQSLRSIFERHTILNARILEIEGNPSQIMNPVFAVEIPVVDLTQIINLEEQNEISRDLLDKNRKTPFDLSTGPLIRFTVLKFLEQISRIHVVFHHLIMDAVAMNILETELKYYYKIFCLNPTADCKLPPLRLQYSNFVMNQRKNHDHEADVNAQAFWETYLKDLTPIALQTDKPRRQCQLNNSASLSGGTGIELSAELTAAIKTFSQQKNTTVFVTLVTALKSLIYLYTGQSDLLLVCATSGRNNSLYENLIGYFVNMNFLRLRALSGKSTFGQLVKNVHESATSIYEFQDFPFQSAIQAANIKAGSNSEKTSTLFRLGVTMEPRVCKARIPGSTGQSSTFSFEKIDYGSKFELLVCFDEKDEKRMQILFAYNKEIYNERRIERMAKHFENLLENAIRFPDQPVESLEFMNQEEKSLCLGYGIGKNVEFRNDRLENLFEQRADSSKNIAIETENEKISYKTLNSNAENLKSSFLEKLEASDDFIAILLPQSVDFIVSTLAILKAGKIVVPLSIDYSAGQLRQMLVHLKQPLLITYKEILAMKELEYSRICSPKIQGTHLGSKCPNPNQVAYCIFTSGSTGVPKAVLVRHDAIVNFTKWMTSEYDISPSTKSLLFCSPAFDFSFAEIWPTLLTLGTLCIPPSELRYSKVERIGDWISEKGVTIACFPTATAERFSTMPKSNHTLKWLICAGECLRSYPSAELPYKVSNWYGLTEATVMTTFMHFNGQQKYPHHIPPVGKAIPNTQVYVLDASTIQPKPVGITGEIFIGGVGVTPGYFGQSGNCDKFIKHSAYGNLCCTGDLGYWLENGNLVVIGRSTDSQVKIRGFRIDLGEIESALREIPGITQAKAMLREKDVLIAYCAGTLQKYEDRNKFLKQRLPQYAIPTCVFLVKDFPLNAVGKIDKEALLALTLDPEMDNLLRDQFQPPKTTEEKLVAQIWSGILGCPLEKISRSDDFFSLGGHSVLASEIVSKLRSAPHYIETRIVDVFQNSVLSAFASTIRMNGQKPSERIVAKKINTEIAKKFPLSISQEQIWLHAQELQRPLLYNESFSLNLKDTPAVDIPAIELSLFQIFQRHEILRATVQEIRGKPFQKITKLGKLPPKLKILDLSRRKETQEELEIFSKKLSALRQRKPFKLSSGTLIRIFLTKFRRDYVRMQVIFHHIIMDAVSVGIFERELRKFYEVYKNNRGVVDIDMNYFVSPLPIQYYDYAMTQEKILDTGENFWKEYLKDLTPVEIPTDYPRSCNSSDVTGGNRNLILSPEVSTKVKEFSRQAQTTPFVIFLTALKTLVYRYTRQQDIFIVSASSGRNRPEIENLIGYFVNMVIIRTAGFEVQGMTFQNMVARVKESTMKVLGHQETPFQTVVAKSELTIKKSDLLRLVVTMEPRDENTACTAFSESFRSLPKYDLTIGIDELDSCYHVGFLYNASLYSEGRMESLKSHFEILLKDALAHPEKSIQTLNLSSPAEIENILHKFNQTKIGFPNEGTILEQFEGQVQNHRLRTALIEDNLAETTYQGLNSEAEVLANALVRACVRKPNDLICVLLPQSKNFIVSTIAILKTGKICVPISVHTPSSQIELMLEQLENPVLITSQAQAQASGISKYNSILYIRKSFAKTSNSMGLGLGRGQMRKSKIAYCIFTSGSTGTPKPVMVNHVALANLMHWMRSEFKIQKEDKSLLFCSPAFDFSLAEIWPFLTCGAALCIPPEGARYDCKELRSMVQKQGITFASLPTATAQQFFANWEQSKTQTHTALRQVIFGGEKLSVLPPVKELPFKVTHCYGLTETTVISTFIHLDKDDSVLPPANCVGKPISNVQVYVLHNSSSLSTTPIGISGHVYIGGVGICSGYFDNAAENERKFAANPFSNNSEDQLCKTGDIGYWLPDGNLCIVGRSDNQIKLRGQRIELGQIETALCKFPAILQAVAQIEPTGDLLTAYCVLTSGKTIVRQELYDFLQKQLPYFALPSKIFVLPTFPLNSVGKIDRKALAAVAAAKEIQILDFTSGEKSTKQKTEEEIIVSKIWGKVLGRPAESFSCKDNFFHVGGNSMMIPLVISELRAVVINGRSANVVNTSTIFSSPVLEDLAKTLRRPPSKIPVPLARPRQMRINYFKEKMPLIIPKTNAANSTKIEAILLTGATGYLGSGILVELLVKTKAKIFCLIRARDTAEANTRVKKCLQLFGRNTTTDTARINCIIGDLTKPKFGLSDANYEKLARRIDSIYHSAAEVNFLKSYQELRVQNVESTKEILRFAVKSKTKILHYVSTLGVLGYSEGVGSQNCKEFIMKEKPLKKFSFGPNELSDGYSQSKWVAEQLVWDAMDAGLFAVIYRPGEIGSHSSRPIINKSDMFSIVVKSCVELGSFPNYKAKLPYATLDFTCAAIVDVSLKPAAFGKVFHVFQTLISLQEVFQMYRPPGKVVVAAMNFNEWLGKLQRAGTSAYSSNKQAQALLALYVSKKGHNSDLTKNLENVIEKQNLERLNFSNQNLMSILGSNVQFSKKDISRYLSLLFA